MTLRKGKFFTPVQANVTLPLVRRIVEDILDLSSLLRGEEGDDNEVSAIVLDVYGQNEGVGEDSASAEQMAKSKALLKFTELMDELEAIGCDYKDWSFDIGLVDFPGIIDGEEVSLCWRSDEPRVEFYHGIHTGFLGRKEIPAELL